MTRTALSQTLQRMFPGAVSTLRSRYGNSGTAQRLHKAIISDHAARVMSGPFTGLLYVQDAVCSALWPKLLGAYEAELHPIIEQIIAHNYQTIIDVGCAEGYYAVGLAFRCPQSQIYAFDTDDKARLLCHKLAQINGLSAKMHIEKACTPTRLNEFSLHQTLLISDCEGYEKELLKPDVVAGLAHCDILVELHDFIVPDLSSVIFSRFAETHTAQIVSTDSRNSSSYPALRRLSRYDQATALAECRPVPMDWAYFKSRSMIVNED